VDAILDVVPPVLQHLFAATADRLAWETGLVHRVRGVTPSRFARALSLFLVREPRASLAQLGQELGVSAAAVSQRLADPAAAAFLRALLGAAFAALAATPVRRVGIPLLQRFAGVYLIDGTTLALPAALADRFPGFGGGTHPGDPSAAAAAKVLVRWRLDTSRATDLLVDAATTADLALARRLPDLPPGALQIGDLGFFDAERFQDLSARGVHWLTRLPTRVCVRGDGGPWQDLAAWLAGLGPDVDRWDGALWVGKVTPLRARVLAHRCPPEVAARRRQRLRERASRKGRSVGARQLVLCDWWVLATDVSADTLRAAEAAALYRARWQIELVFKRWKSLGHLTIDRTLGPHRALATLYGLLLGLLIVDWLAVQRGGALAERSAWQAWRIVRRALDRLELALRGVLPWGFVLTDLSRTLDRRAKHPHRKKRPTTRQHLFRSTLVA
jgi:hypothetical protein